jgi:uncharacterized protein (TIRG00374 family)
LVTGATVDTSAARLATTEQNGDLDDDLLSGPPWRRHPLDLVRLAVASVVLAVAVVLTWRRTLTVRRVSGDLVVALAELPGWARVVLVGTTQLLAVAVPVAMVIVLVRTPRLLATAAASAAVAAGVTASLQGRIDQSLPTRVVDASLDGSFLVGAAFPSGAYLAGYAAVLVVLGPVLSLGWRRAALVGLGLASFARVVTAVAAPLNIALTVAIGAAAGSAALAALGSPRRRASRRAVLDGLGRAGFPAVRLVPLEVGSTHAQTFLASTSSGRRAFVKLLGRDERSADLLNRALRFLRVKDLDDERPAWSPAEIVDHDALTTLLAHRAGVAVPDVVAVGSTEGGDGLLGLAVVDGERLDRLPVDEVTDAVLDAAWAQLVTLRRQGIAHRWLSGAHLLVTLDGDAAPAVTMLDLRWSVRQADAAQLGADVAALVVATARLVGAERAVAAAARALAPEDLAAALPLVQPLALPDDLRTAIKGDDALLPLVRSQLQAAAGGATYQLARIERVGRRQLVGLVGLVAISYFGLSFASNARDIASALGTVSLSVVPVLAVLAVVPYLAGAATFASVVPRPLPFAEVVRVMAGQSFLNRFTPANAGGMALRVRYLQKRGVDVGGAAATVALTGVASAIGQVVVLATFAAWAGSTQSFSFSLPDASSVAVGAALVLALAGVVWLTPFGRRVLARHIETTTRSVWRTLLILAKSPTRFVTLFTTTLVSKVATIFMFVVSVDALGITLSFPKLGLLYLTASSVAAIAPTPGGVGAVEAALTAALTGAGAPPAEALSAVLLFRLASYWLPVPFGWWALHRLREGVLA